MTLEEAQAEITNLRGQVATLESAQDRINRESKTHRLNAEAFQKQADEQRAAAEAAKGDIDKIAKAHAEELDRLKIDLTGRATAAEKAAEEASASAKSRVMMADLRVAARETGMIDLDGLKLLDLAQAKQEDDGTLSNATELLAAMKEAKPYLFGVTPAPGTATGTTATTVVPPRAAPPSGFNAMTATDADYTAKRAELAQASRRA